MPSVRLKKSQLRLGGPLTLSLLSPTALSGDVNDYAPTGGESYPAWRVDTGGSTRQVTGLANGVDGRELTIINIATAGNINLVNASSSSAAANRILGSNGADMAVRPGGGITLVYDATSLRWRPKSNI